MIDFERLKRSYVSTIQIGLASNIGYHAAKQGNELLHKFCENLIEDSACTDQTKISMKQELELLKEMLSREIDSHYR